MVELTSHIHLVGGELDFSTPPQTMTKELLPYLPNGQQVVLPGIGHTGTFFAVQPEASSRLINTFFDNGKVDDSLYHPETVDFTPAHGFGQIAKVFLGLALALATLTVLSLLWMAWWVHKRGGFGTKASTVLRSLYPIILGPGGWLLGIADRPSDGAQRPDRRRAPRRPINRRARRPRDLPGLGASGLVSTEQTGRIGGRSRWRASRCLARIPCHGWPDGAGHRDPRSRCRRQPRIDPARRCACPLR
jgi:hypothetical protein